MSSSIPVCFYPLKKIFLDDDKIFLQSLSLKMYGNNIDFFDSPQKTLDYLKDYQPSLRRTKMVNENDDLPDSSTEKVISLDISKIVKSFLENEQDICVLFVDYHMPEMNGIEFLEKIQHLPVKKVLLTGETNHQIGIDALNEKLIDAYIRKDDPELIDKINKFTRKLEWDYFITLSNVLDEIIDFDYLRNMNFTSMFQNFLCERNIVKFCLSHIQGDFVLVDKHSKKYHLIVRNKTQLNDLVTIAKEDGANLETIKLIEQKKALPYFCGQEHWNVPANEWNNYLIPTISPAIDKHLSCAITN